MRVIGCVAIMILAGLAGCLGTDEMAPHVQPEWQSGAVHAYRAEGEVVSNGVQNGRDLPPQREQIAFTGIEKVFTSGARVGGTPAHVTALHYKDSSSTESETQIDLGFLGGEQNEQDRNQLRAYRQEDLWDTSATLQGDGLKLEDPFPSRLFLDFPLETGKVWSSPPWFRWNPTYNWGQGPFTANFDVEVTSRVIGPSTAQVPAGDIDSVLIQQTYRVANLADWAETLRVQGQRAGNTITDVELKYNVDVMIHYSPDYGVPVLTEFDWEFFQKIAGTKGDREIRHSAALQMDFSFSLIGARLVPGPNHGMDHIASFLRGEVEIPDPTGETHDPADYEIQIEGDEAATQTGDSVPLRASPERSSLPPGHDYAWRLVAPNGRILDEADGETVEFAVAEPGIHQVELTTIDANGTVRAADGLTLPVNHRPTLTMECTVSDRCEIDVPVRPGIQGLTLEAEPFNPLFAVTEGRLVLQNSTGETVDETQGVGTLQIGLEEFSSHNLSYVQDWTLFWETGIEGLENFPQEVEYRMDLRFDEGDSAAPPDE